MRRSRSCVWLVSEAGSRPGGGKSRGFVARWPAWCWQNWWFRENEARIAGSSSSCQVTLSLAALAALAAYRDQDRVGAGDGDGELRPCNFDAASRQLNEGVFGRKMSENSR